MVGEEEALVAFPPDGPPRGGWATAAELQAALSPLEALYAQLLEAVQVCLCAWARFSRRCTCSFLGRYRCVGLLLKAL